MEGEAAGTCCIAHSIHHTNYPSTTCTPRHNLPTVMYNCTGGDGPSPSPSATASAASAPAPPVTKKGGGGSSGGGGGQGAQCSDLKDKKGCRTAKAGCAWCVGKFTPPMCVEEDQAKYLPAMVYECKGPKKAAAAAPLEAAADGDGADDEDEEEEQAQEEEAGARLAVALFEVEKGALAGRWAASFVSL